jgi:hypothetical protein
METLASGMDHQLENVYSDFEDRFGFGPCGVYATIRRSQGWGEIAVCNARTQDGTEFGHYVIIQDGGIIDLTNPFGEEMEYSDIVLLDPDELPEIVDQESIAWMEGMISSC